MIILIFILYLAAYIFIPLNDGLYWDDWVVFHQSSSTLVSFSKESGFFLYWPAYLDNLILPLNHGIIIERLLIFLSFLFSSLLLFAFLSRIKEIDKISRLLIVLFFSLFPLNFSRVAISSIRYALSYFLFFWGLWFVGRYFDNRKIRFRITALLLLFLSFSTSSLLFFYLVVLLYIAYRERSLINSLRALITRSLRYKDFLILPVAFWILKILFFKPYGLYYNNYNQIYLQHPFKFLYQTFVAFDNTFIYLFIYELAPFFSSYVVLILITSLILLMILKKIINTGENNKLVKYDIWFLILGFITFFAGVFPYLVVGKMPLFQPWESRHQLLLPLGLSLILYYLLKICFYLSKINSNIKLFIYSLIISLFIFYNGMKYLEYQADWFKQLSLIENFKNSEILKNNTTFIFEDRTLALNAQNRRYNFYEFNGLMKYAFGDQKRFGSDIRGYKDIKNFQIYISDPKYNMYDYELTEPQYKVIIDFSQPNFLTKQMALKLLLLKYINNREYINEIQKIISLDYVPLHGENKIINRDI